MMIFNELNEENLILYAAKAYYKPKFSDIEEFYEDLKRFKYIKRLVNRYVEQGILNERLILNHLIVTFNSFGIEPALNILKLKMNDSQWPIVKPFLLYLNYININDLPEYSMDETVIATLRQI